MKIEVSILLGLNCNFSCASCINQSRPNYTDFDISESEINVIVNEITSNLDINKVSFTGGELLLYLPTIKSIIDRVRSIRKNITFSVTTNGSLISKYSQELLSLGITHALISYDHQHSQYLLAEEMEESITLAKEVFESVEVESFKKQQSLAFSLPHKYIIHKKNNSIVAAFILIKVENHPLFKKTVWHIGYWGISQQVSSKPMRSSIKEEWRRELLLSSQDCEISVIVDDFNLPSLNLAKKYGIILSLVRLDSR